MKTAITFLFLLVTGCGGLVFEPCDAGSPVLDGAPANWTPGFITARRACSSVGAFYQAAPFAGGDCAQIACPLDYDRTGRTTVVCTPEAVERCEWALDSRANDCETYADVMARECAGIPCAVAP